MAIKHVSFDFWDTLYIGNPNFRVQRADYLQKKYGHSVDFIHAAVKEVKTLCDDTSEKTMTTVDSLTQCWHLLDMLGVASVKGALELAEETHRIFLENPPVPCFTIEDFIGLRSKKVSISISCNTGLIAGESIGEMLKRTSMYHLFDFTLFSDIISHFKPSPFFMREVLMYSKSNLYSEILHIGDNPDTDGYMCKLTGAEYIQNQKGVLDFKEIHKYL